MNSVMVARNLAANTDRGPSGAIWGNCPWNTYREDPSKGQTFFDDFQMAGNATMSSALAASIGQWSMYGYAGAQVNDAQLEGGVIKIGADGDNEGLTLLSSAGSFRFLTTSTLALNRRMWFECRFARSTVAATKHDVFVGLMAPTLASGLPAAAQPITTTDDTLMTAGDLFGFHIKGTASPTEVSVAFELASGTINYPTNLTAIMAASGNSVLVADTYVKVGFLFDPSAYTSLISSATARQTAGNIRKKLIRFFVNGLETPAFLSSDDVVNATATQAFPTAFMSPVISIMNQTGSTPGTLNVDWIRIAQEANS